MKKNENKVEKLNPSESEPTACSRDAECGPGEICQNGFCQYVRLDF